VILKNLTRRNNTKQLVDYLFKKEKDKKPEPILKHNMRNRSTKGWAKEIDKNNSLRLHKRKDNITLNHTIISFSNKDKKQINDALLKDISKKYVELRGKDNMYLASKHADKDHIHLHIVMPAVKYQTGESNRISKMEFRELKLALDAYQKEKYPELVNSLPNHGKSLKSRQSEREFQLQIREGKLSQKQQILETTEAVYSKSKSKDDFLSQLKSEGFELYYRGGKLFGVEDENGRHFRFSTLGFDKDKLENLDRKLDNAEDKELQELSDLRESANMDKEQEDEREIDTHSSEETDDTDSEDSEDSDDDI
jgi:hypothetical protein